MFSPRSYEAPSSLWDIICEHSAPSEHHELKHLIGPDLIDQTLELRREIRLLLELSVDEPSDDESHESVTPQRPAALPEPPQMRARLAQEIVFFLEAIREQQRSLDLKKFDVNQDVVDYAYESSSSRPSTGTSRLSHGEIRVTPCSSARSGSRRTGRSAEGASAADDVAGMRDQLTYMRCDEVRRILRHRLQEEIDQLKEDLEQLQDWLQMQQSVSTSRTDASRASPMPATPTQRWSSREPTLSDLRTERHKLERALLEACKDQPALREPRRSASLVGASSSSYSATAAKAGSLHSNKAVNETIPRPLAPLATTSASKQQQRPSSAQRLRSMVQQSRQQWHESHFAAVPPLDLPTD